MPEMSSGYAGGGIVRTYGAVAGTSSESTYITSSATANVKGSAVELVASTEFDANWVIVSLKGAATAVHNLVDLLVGAATEEVVIPDMYCRVRSGITGLGSSWSPYIFPVFIPKGSRLSARIQSSTGSRYVRIAVTLIGGTVMSGGTPSVVSAYGDSATSIGTFVDPGGTADTDSSWVEITASTVRDHHWLVASGFFGDGSLAGTTVWRFDIGIGGSTEEVLIPAIHTAADATADLPFACVWTFPVFIPRGSRLSIRMRCNSITSGDRSANFKLYGAG